MVKEANRTIRIATISSPSGVNRVFRVLLVPIELRLREVVTQTGQVPLVLTVMGSTLPS
jgi:hypothetical protein